ncbi:GNAT family N-acetyltransferase [Streptococcus sciuri]|uniref:GNAT family N-acetyltransferase n=1 Tax=Streptococcus sciuri TaxID=2973939 RepID=A0ABT2F649_9STRE|nr:GNAT family N-acetyltransferase [Streptococcus sciuri]MCS4487914.1 GNAT family N-acetyltransferase [Streptococcus sciuri]
MQLRRPNPNDKEAILEMIAEFQEKRSAMDGGFYKPELDYEDWLESLSAAEMGLNLPKDFVPFIQFVAFNEKNQALGFLNLRLRLNDKLLQKGGHIGYSIRPSKRNKGYAKEQLRLGLLEAKSKNITEVLITCHERNVASRLVILANGGQYIDKQKDIERYIITLS